jgi:uncharacterized protein
MIRAFLDANVVASGLLRFDVETSPPGTRLRSWFAGEFVLVTSDPLVKEIERTIASPYFASRISQRTLALFWAQLAAESVLAEITHFVTGIASHPEDDLVLAAAVSADVDYLVTGDRMLLQLGSYQNIAIVNPRQYLSVLESMTSQNI